MITNGYVPTRTVTPFDRIFANFLHEPATDPAPAPAGERQWAPRADVVADADGYTFRFDVPGVSIEDMEINVEDGTLHVAGQRKDVHEDKSDTTRYYRESFYGKFDRRFKLPTDIDPESLTATYRDGVLEIKVSREEKVKTRKIQISAN